ncbi:hypothetical protein [Devosia sp.]|uniref:hypothetical protein n=1 Tax=Devosia sp. TaxID=1871048 RepID=UPI002931C128|nr:hypothetical protein [Devosia sp.]
MSNSTKARTGAILFALWGIVHIAGGASILLALSGSPGAGFGIYQNSAGTYPALAGQVLGYLASLFVAGGIAVTGVAIRLNWRNSALGLGLNTVIAGIFDLGLVVFLVLPGHVSWPEAAIGIVLLLAAAIVGGMACNAENTPAHA